ncbi:MAG: cytoplasmic protein [Nitrospirae bacterium GWC2_57_13]|jgi:uncharacterized protein (DUF362 family)|nr:MAG: cytoplasmic protein [Nitrospirae bacterium GWC2_57_13]OGW45518.1 MAG: cytoplasmic protein [Nitrospirae bacterium GWD2_57_8]
MDRRKFLRSAALAGIGLSFPGGLKQAAEAAQAGPDLAVVQGPSAAAITRAAIEALGGMKKFVSRGDIVVVKPNIAWDRVPEQAGDTNPEVVAEVVRLCIEAGAKKVKVFDRPVNDPRRCYVQSGIAEAARDKGADVIFMDDRKFKDMEIKGIALKTWPLYTEVIEADTVINVPIAKHHGLAKLTMSMKNWMGVMGGSRRMIHQKLDESIVDLARAIRPKLTVLDAVRILTDNGPQGGDLDDVKRLDTVIAGTDQVAIDSYGATLFGMKGSDLGYVRIGAETGFGVMDLAKLNIRKMKV